MSSVTQRIKEIKQPYGGYIKPSEFEKNEFNDSKELKEENIHPSLVGLAVDYMTRFIMGADIEKAFDISLRGSAIVGEETKANKLLNRIDGLNRDSIINACKLVGYDVCFRAGLTYFKNVDEINPDDNTINNIIIMVNRGVKFFNKYGPIIKDGFTFEGAYTDVINSGDGDFLTSDTLWDFKVSSKPPTSENTLQLLIYYIMGKKSIHSEFKNIKIIGIFNPRLNIAYLKDVSDISLNVMNEVYSNVIGYNNKTTNIDKNDKCRRLEIPEIMKALHCSVYEIFEYYAEEDLPLKKEKKQYYIYKDDLDSWIEEQKKDDKILSVVSKAIGIIIFLAVIIAIIIILS